MTSKSKASRAPSLRDFIRVVRRLPSDRPVHRKGAWYRTQREHWLGWLKDYPGPGAYGRKTAARRDARYAYNHIVEPLMLIWLISAAGV
jgi:hypothetical protein